MELKNFKDFIKDSKKISIGSMSEKKFEDNIRSIIKKNARHWFNPNKEQLKNMNDHIKNIDSLLDFEIITETK